MKTYDFISSLKDEMMRFIGLKQLSGSDCYAQAKILRYFDRFLCSEGFAGKILTRGIFQSYFNTLVHLHPRTFSNRYSLLRQFSIWLNRTHRSSCILEKRPEGSRYQSRPAYIFCSDEVKAVLSNCHRFSSKEECIENLYLTLFSLLYSTGIRIGEALALNWGDYTPDEKLIHIRKGKFSKQRHLILSRSMAKHLDRYQTIYQSTLLKESDSPLFLNMRGNRLRLHNVHLALKKVLKMSDIEKGKETGPRLHDFHHTFAVHRLLGWYETEKDINSELPFLATYMGHVNINNTRIYLQATSELLQAGCERFHGFFLGHNT